MGTNCFRLTDRSAEVSGPDEDSLLDRHEKEKQQEIAAPAGLVPSEVTQPAGESCSQPAQGTRRSRRRTNNRVSRAEDAVGEGTDAVSPSAVSLSSYVIDCKVSINASEVLEEYDALRQKTTKLFSAATSSASSDPAKPKGKKRRGKPGRTVPLLPEPLEIVERGSHNSVSGTEAGSTTPNALGHSLGCESFSSKFTDDTCVEPVEFSSFNAAKKQWTRSSHLNKSRKQTHYVKKVASTSFIERLNAEMAAALVLCDTFHSSTLPLCSTIQEQVQSLAREVFHSTVVCAVISAYRSCHPHHRLRLHGHRTRPRGQRPRPGDMRTTLRRQGGARRGNMQTERRACASALPHLLPAHPHRPRSHHQTRTHLFALPAISMSTSPSSAQGSAPARSRSI